MNSDRDTRQEKDWDGAVEDVLEKVAEHEATRREVAERQKPRGRGPLLVVLVAVLSGVAAWDAWMLTRPPEGLPPEVVAADLRLTVAFAVEAIEDFRAEHMRLPTADEVEAYLGSDVTYEASGDAFVVTAGDAGTRVRYDGTLPLAEWLARAEDGS